MIIDVKELTTYSIADGGETVALRLKDEAGQEAVLRFKIPDLGNLVMTLPGLIEAALRQQYCDRDTPFRFAYPVGSWSVEAATDPGAVILTLRTADGFGVSFSMGRAHAEKLGRSIAPEIDRSPATTTH